VDFADAANKGTGGTCSGNAGGTCLVNTNSVFTGGTVTGVTLPYNTAVTNAVNEWNALIAGSAWGSNTGATAVNLGSGSSGYVLCAGSGQTGCTTTNLTTTTRTINGTVQTAYLFDLSTTTGGVINQNVTIKGDGSTPGGSPVQRRFHAERGEIDHASGPHLRPGLAECDQSERHHDRSWL
jgi:hypothetical protein